MSNWAEQMWADVIASARAIHAEGAPAREAARLRARKDRERAEAAAARRKLEAKAAYERDLAAHANDAMESCGCSWPGARPPCTWCTDVRPLDRTE